MKIVTFVTPEYDDIVKTLLASAEKFGYDIVVEEIDSYGSWEMNTAQKAHVVFKHLCMREPFLITDADSEIIREIDLSDFNGSPIMARMKRGVEFLSGTMYFNPTQIMFGIVADWAYRASSDARVLEQTHLHRSLTENNVSITALPDRYCAIFDEQPEIVDPVILHHQASRKMRRKIGR